MSLVDTDILVKTVGLKQRRSHSTRLECNKNNDRIGEDCIKPAKLEQRYQDRKYVEEHGYPKLPVVDLNNIRNDPSTSLIHLTQLHIDTINQRVRRNSRTNNVAMHIETRSLNYKIFKEYQEKSEWVVNAMGKPEITSIDFNNFGKIVLNHETIRRLVLIKRQYEKHSELQSWDEFMNNLADKAEPTKQKKRKE